MSALSRLVRRLRGSASGTAVIEFALGAPVLLGAALWGAEVANRAVVQMRINQIAVLIADNASRVGENSLLGEAKLYEGDIDDVLYGPQVQGARRIKFYENGRVVLSSLEVVPGTEDAQFIRWQRCMGKLKFSSDFGPAGTGADGSFAGMGPKGAEIIAFKGEAVMFVEVAYVYQPIISNAFAPDPLMKATAAFNVRENRELAEPGQRFPSSPDPVASCDKYQTAQEFMG